MGLLDSVLGAVSGKTDSGGANALVGVLGGLLQQSGGLQGLASKFSQGGCGNVFASWVGLAVSLLSCAWFSLSPRIFLPRSAPSVAHVEAPKKI